MRDVDHDDVGTGAQELGRAFEVITFGPDGGADSKPPVIVARRKGEPLLLDQVLRGDESQSAGLLCRRAGSFLILCARMTSSAAAASIGPSRTTSRSRGVIRSDTAPRMIREAKVTGRQQADDPAAFVDDDERADAGATHGVGGFCQRRVRPNRVRVCDDPVLAPLDTLDFTDLRLDVA